MTWGELKEARRELGLTADSMARLLRVSPSTYKGWKTRGCVPDYIVASVEAHILLPKKEITKLIAERCR